MSEITRFPLCWPLGWPRIAPDRRLNARFTRGEKVYSSDRQHSWYRHRRVTVAEGVRRVLDQLDKLGVVDGDAIISTNIRTRLDGLPYSEAKEPADAGAAVYWRRRDLPQAPMKCMAIDQYSRCADNLAAIAATLEAMRAIERHGGAQILDRAFMGFDALPAPGHTRRAWYDVLQCRADASMSVREAQYRRLRSDAHPDKGGSEAAFNEVQRAWEEAQR